MFSQGGGGGGVNYFAVKSLFFQNIVGVILDPFNYSFNLCNLNLNLWLMFFAQYLTHLLKVEATCDFSYKQRQLPGIFDVWGYTLDCSAFTECK